MQDDPDILLKVRDLRVEAYSDEGWTPIVKGVDITLRRGEVLGLIGESGAGKSTLGLAAMGFVRDGCRIAGGSIVFDGQNLVRATDAEKERLWGSRLTYVAQSAAAAFNPAQRLLDQTIAPTVREGLRRDSDARKGAVHLYKALMLPEPEKIGSRFPHQVSGGQLQRVMTAMAMEPRPALIVFDEPTTALDVTTQVEVLLAIRKAVSELGTAAIYITHDLAVVSQMADTIKVMRFGEEVEEAPTKTMLSAPRHEYTRSLWSVRMLKKPAVKSGDTLLSLEGITAGYGNHSVLKDVSLRLPRGSAVAIVGESGSGKSTTARVAAGLLRPRAGRVLMDGAYLPLTLGQRSKEQLRRIQMIYQMADTAMNPRQSVAEIIGRPLTFYHGLVGSSLRKRVEQLLTDIELDGSFLHRLPSELSGGQKQRICIARALAAEPEVMICDEITSALDQVVKAGILKLLMRLQVEKGLSYLFITHDFATVDAIADEVIIMHRGQVVEQGPKDEILSPPYPAYTELLLSSVPEIDPNWLLRQAEKRGLSIPPQ